MNQTRLNQARFDRNDVRFHPNDVRFGPICTQFDRNDVRFYPIDVRFDVRLNPDDVRFDPVYSLYARNLRRVELSDLFKQVEDAKMIKRREEIDQARKNASMTRFIRKESQDWDDEEINFNFILEFNDNMDLSD
jgi:LPS O-antigen subunit length determinant protein (WzzB/FepE family)